MAEHDSKQGLDYNELADNVDEMREMIRALVAGLEADGFTPREARALVAGLFAANIKGHETEEGSA